VLLVDDDAEVRTTVRRVLALYHQVVEAADGRAAVEYLRGGAPIDVVVLDVHMPGWSGLEAAAVIRSEFPEVRVVFLSGTFDADGLASINVAVLRKPVRARELLATVERALARRAPVE
jgi:CheY-like chemotaxis protein